MVQLFETKTHDFGYENYVKNLFFESKDISFAYLRCDRTVIDYFNP